MKLKMNVEDVAVSMAKATEIETRLKRVLDVSRSRKPLSRRLVAIVTLSVATGVPLLATGAPQQATVTAQQATVVAQREPKRTKRVKVSIRDINSSYSGSVSTSFTVGPKSNPTVTVYWNGYGFICKEDSGRTFWSYSNDLAFKGQAKAAFVIEKNVTITEKDGTKDGLSTSEAISVQRGVPRHLFQHVFPKS
jgi:hypothetical protein